jgi:rhamnosyltransferase
MPKAADISSCPHVGPTRENICAVIVSYFPDEGFLSRVSQVRSQVGHVLIVDNGSDPTAFAVVKDALKKEAEADIIQNPCNLGIAKALNQGIDWAQENGFVWVLLLDQDSTPFQDMVLKLMNVYEEFPDKSCLAIIGCSAFHDSRSRSARSVGGALWAERKAVITSGTLLRLDVVQQIGPFWEEFFIDCVDFEFCLRAGCAGFKIVEVLAPVMRHVIGAPQRVPFQWLARETSSHRPWRSYYMTRNLVVLVREYIFREPAWIWNAVRKRINGIILMMLFEKSRIQKVKYIVLGLYDGLTGRFDRSVV